MPIYAEKLCDMRTLLKYAKNAAIACSRKTDVPNTVRSILFPYITSVLPLTGGVP